jgi:hypothetical protein
LSLRYSGWLARKNRNKSFGIRFLTKRDAQRIDSDGFIKTVRAVDVPLTESIYSGETKTVEICDNVEKIRVKKDGSIVFNDLEIL